MLHTPDQTHQQTDTARLDYLITRLEDSNDPQKDLLLEHLACARTFLLGAMPEEYAYNLHLAEDAAASLSDERLQRDLKKAIPSLLTDVTAPRSVIPSASHHHHRHSAGRGPIADVRPGSTQLTAFFHGKDVAHGIFYPKKYVVAVFATFDEARAARDVFLRAGFGEDELLAVAGGEVLNFLETLRQDAGLWGELMTELSRLLDTEARMVDHYDAWARKGAGFLVVYCEEEPEAEEITMLIRPLKPLAAHWYMPAYIRHLV